VSGFWGGPDRNQQPNNMRLVLKFFGQSHQFVQTDFLIIHKRARPSLVPVGPATALGTRNQTAPMGAVQVGSLVKLQFHWTNRPLNQSEPYHMGVSPHRLFCNGEGDNLG
jgi:hypothetical protein